MLAGLIEVYQGPVLKHSFATILSHHGYLVCSAVLSNQWEVNPLSFSLLYSLDKQCCYRHQVIYSGHV